MDILSSRSAEIIRLAMNGLSRRQEAIASNVANVSTPDYQRKEVCFETQLNNIIERDNVRKKVRAFNGTLSTDEQSYFVSDEGFIEINDKPKALPTEQLKFLSQNDYNKFQPEILRDYSMFDVENNNNVDIEKEMTDMAKNGLKFNALATLEAKAFSGLSELIKSGGT